MPAFVVLKHEPHKWPHPPPLVCGVHSADDCALFKIRKAIKEHTEHPLKFHSSIEERKVQVICKKYRNGTFAALVLHPNLPADRKITARLFPPIPRVRVCLFRAQFSILRYRIILCNSSSVGIYEGREEGRGVTAPPMFRNGICWKKPYPYFYPYKYPKRNFTRLCMIIP